MQIFDFSQSFLASTCEKDLSVSYTTSTAGTSNFSNLGVLQSFSTSSQSIESSSVEISSCTYPIESFAVMAVMLLFLIWGIYKISCMIAER